MIEIDLSVEADGWDAVPGLEALVRRAAEAAALEGGLPAEAPADLSVLCCDDAAIAALNAQWRGQNKPTNVLSFPATGRVPPGLPRPLGDLALAWDTVAREAAAEDKPVADHITHLVVHGVLHLLGLDHETAREAEAMEARERAVLAGLGVPDPYENTDLLEAGPEAPR